MPARRTPTRAVGEALRRAIAERGLTTPQVMRGLGRRNAATGYRVLSGQTADPQTSTLVALCRAIGVDVDAVVGSSAPLARLDPELRRAFAELAQLSEDDRWLAVDVLRTILARLARHAGARATTKRQGQDRGDPDPAEEGLPSTTVAAAGRALLRGTRPAATVARIRAAMGVGDAAGRRAREARVPTAEYETWHVYDAGGPERRLKVRYRDDAEVPDWRDGPDLADALEQAAAEGWRAYDREPGNARGEYAIFHMKRDARPGRQAPHRVYRSGRENGRR